MKYEVFEEDLNEVIQGRCNKIKNDVKKELCNAIDYQVDQAADILSSIIFDRFEESYFDSILIESRNQYLKDYFDNMQDSLFMNESLDDFVVVSKSKVELLSPEHRHENMLKEQIVNYVNNLKNKEKDSEIKEIVIKWIDDLKLRIEAL